MAVKVRVRREKLVSAIKAFIAEEEAKQAKQEAVYAKSLEVAVKKLKERCDEWLKKTPHPSDPPKECYPYSPSSNRGIGNAKKALKRLELSDEDYLDLSDKDDYLSYL